MIINIDTFFKYLPRNSIRWILIIAIISVVIFIIQLMYQEKKIIKEIAIRDARLYLNTLEQFRTLYTSEVIKRLEGTDIPITHNYKQTEHGIPLPATLSIMLADAIGKSSTGIRARLFSRYPFPWRENEGGPKDPFEQQALSTLEKNPTTFYYQFTEHNGEKFLRIAKADRMRRDCISCHNTHPDTPKKDWKVGDTRGVLAITFPLENQQLALAKRISTVLFIMLGILISVITIFFATKTWRQDIKDKQL